MGRGIVEGIGTVVEMVEMVERGGKRGGWMRVGWVDEEVKGLRDSEILVAQLVEAFD